MIKSLILFAHCARNPNWAEQLLYLRTLVQSGLPKVIVELAFLELMLPNLIQLVKQLIIKNVQHITIVPIFLG